MRFVTVHCSCAISHQMPSVLMPSPSSNCTPLWRQWAPVYASFGCLASCAAMLCGRFFIFNRRIVLPPIKKLTTKIPCNFVLHSNHSLRTSKLSTTSPNEKIILCHWPLLHIVYDDQYAYVRLQTSYNLQHTDTACYQLQSASALHTPCVSNRPNPTKTQTRRITNFIRIRSFIPSQIHLVCSRNRYQRVKSLSIIFFRTLIISVPVFFVFSNTKILSLDIIIYFSRRVYAVRLTQKFSVCQNWTQINNGRKFFSPSYSFCRADE